MNLKLAKQDIVLGVNFRTIINSNLLIVVSEFFQGN